VVPPSSSNLMAATARPRRPDSHDPPSVVMVIWHNLGKVYLMAKNIYVGNLVWDCSSDDLLQLFQQHGTVKSAQVIIDRETNRSRGFGFVEMDSDEEALRAIEALNGFDFKGRPLTVNEAKPREPRPPRSGGYGGGGYGGGGYGGGGYGGRR